MNILDAVNADLEASADLAEFQQESLAEWYEPIFRIRLQQMWQGIDEATKQELRQMRPDVYAAMSKEVENA